MFASGPLKAISISRFPTTQLQPPLRKLTEEAPFSWMEEGPLEDQGFGRLKGERQPKVGRDEYALG